MIHRLSRVFLFGSLLGAIALWWNPVASRMNNGGFLLFLGTSWLLGLFLLWKRTKLRNVLLLLPLMIASPLALPGKTIDSAQLRQLTLKKIKNLEGTDYFWGGESARGVDCSGLPRLALRRALISTGFQTLNGDAFRLALANWWNDTSALALSQGLRNSTFPLRLKGTIATLDETSLQPGDLAITRGGVHVIVYIGNGMWAQADPALDQVVIQHGKNDENRWFESPVTLHRWKILAQN